LTTSALHVDFRLRPLREIAPWHNADGSNPHLDWFGLTDGWYWIEVGEVELFRYSQAVLDKWAWEAGGEPWFAQKGGLPYLDYQVAQLWGDLLGFLPDVLAPVPPRLALAVASGAWMQWEREAEAAVMEALPKREASNLLYDAMRWLGKREVDSAYLVSGPAIRCWSDGAQVHLQWDNRDRMLDGLPLWEATTGHHTLPPAVFHDAIGDFNKRFMRRMADRVAIAQGGWARPEVTLAPHLAEAHLANADWAQGRLAARAPQEPDDWDLAFAGIARIEALPRFTSSTAQRLA
jgi:hypothetical protein